MSGDAETQPDAQRIAKVLARAGVCSRREAERLIEAGRVSVDGATLSSPAHNVRPDQDIRVDGAPIPQRERTRLFRYHKPDDLIVSRGDPRGRKTIFEALPEGLPRLVSVGRLDLTSEGLLLLTNDGELARILELPQTGWTRRYRARAFGRPNEADLEKLRRGLVVDGVKYGPIDAMIERQTGGNTWMTLALKEGKNREVRKALQSLGLTVNRLIRTAYGPFQLGALPKSDIAEVTRKQLREQLGRLYEV